MPRRKNKNRARNRRRFMRRQAPRRLFEAHEEAKVPVYAPPKLSEMIRAASTPEKKEDWIDLGDSKVRLSRLPVLKLPLVGMKGLFKRYETRICLGGLLHANTGVSYLSQWDIAGVGTNNGTLAWAQVGNASEFSVLDQLFDEFFIRSAALVYKPHNKYSANSEAASTGGAGSPGAINTCAGTIVFLPHNSAVYANSSTAWVAMRSAEQSKVIDMGSPFTLVARNTEKFSWDGPLGDQTTSGTTMAWGNIAKVAQYGGLFQTATAIPTAAAPGATALTESGQFGDWLLEFDIAFRARA